MDARYSLSQLSDSVLVRAHEEALARESEQTALLVAQVAEMDSRRIYVPAGYPSLFRYCVERFRQSPDVVYLRIRAARVARRFRQVLVMLADGRLHLSAVVALKPYLTRQNADELLTAATHKSRREVREMLALRFPRPDVPSRVEPVLPPRALVPEPSWPEPAPPSPLETPVRESPAATLAAGQLVPEPVSFSAAEPEPLRAEVALLAPERYEVHCTIPRETYERLCRIQERLGREVPSCGLPEVLELAFRLLEHDLDRRKCAATEHPHRAPRRASRNPRHVPAEVKRAVWKRDHGQCTFVSDDGRRCEARVHLELDHVEPVAKGGRASVANLRLRCRAHNQYAADQEFGAGYMGRKRGIARNGASGPAPVPHTMEWQLAREAHERELVERARAEDERVRAAAEVALEEVRARSRAAMEEALPRLRALGIGLGPSPPAHRAAEALQAAFASST